MKIVSFMHLQEEGRKLDNSRSAIRCDREASITSARKERGGRMRKPRDRIDFEETVDYGIRIRGGRATGPGELNYYG